MFVQYLVVWSIADILIIGTRPFIFDCKLWIQYRNPWKYNFLQTAQCLRHYLLTSFCASVHIIILLLFGSSALFNVFYDVIINLSFKGRVTNSTAENWVMFSRMNFCYYWKVINRESSEEYKTPSCFTSCFFSQS